MYRTKVLSYLYKYYLKPILEFDGLTIDPNDIESKVKRMDADENGKPAYLSNLDGTKMLSFVKDKESFYAYRRNKDNLEFFNPFIKYKQCLLLLLMSTPMLYTRYCKNIDEDSESDLSDMIASEVVDIPQSEILKYVNIEQLTTRNEDDEPIYSFSITLNSDSGDNWRCVYASPVKIVSIIMLLLSVIEYIDIAPEIFNMCDCDWNKVEEDLIKTLDMYLKERNLNKKDMKKEQLLENDGDNIEFNLSNSDVRDIDSMDGEDFLNSGEIEDESDEEKVANKESEDITKTEAYKSVFVNSDQLMDDDWQHLTFI